MGSIGVFSFLFFIFQSAASGSDIRAHCQLRVTKTLIPFSQKIFHESLCLEDYMHGRRFAEQSLTEDASGFAVIADDPLDIQYDDMLLLETPLDPNPSLGRDGRLKWVTQILDLFFGSLHNSHGACELKFYSGKTQLSRADFMEFSRDAQGHSGTRLMLTKDDVKDPRWELLCPQSSGSWKTQKKGDYFFVFVDVYENNGQNQKLRGHLAKYLFAFR